MTKKLLTISLLLPLIAASASAFAGSTITDKSYWPNEARQRAQGWAGSSQGDPNSAFAYDRIPSRLQPTTNPNDGGTAWRYHGGPKSR
ncbi:hypothetical protein [Bradyrhizobium sp. 2TAF24]|jgi:hypothetical protein|uniref:hypothetical protein n=1 Tax=Bradyrhizobium sp. 2TAF24 TaxID=3233011 RepID=UPI003F8F2133